MIVKNKTKKKILILSAVLAVLIAGSGIGSTLAYFTTHTYAIGGQPIMLGYSSKMKESVSEKAKHLTITVDEGSETVFIRAKAFSGAEHPFEYSGENWSTTPPEGTITDGVDGYTYYRIPVEGTAGLSEEERSTTVLDVTFDLPADAEEGDQFNLAVIYECTPAKYHEDGSAYADWTTVLEVKQSTEGGN